MRLNCHHACLLLCRGGTFKVPRHPHVLRRHFPPVIECRRCVHDGSSTSDTPPEENLNRLCISMNHGLPELVVPLPSRCEKCQFMLRPLGDSVGTLCDHLVEEDSGIEIVGIYTKNGIRISRATNIQQLLTLREFLLRINDTYYVVAVETEANSADTTAVDMDNQKALDGLRTTVSALYNALEVDEFRAGRETLLQRRLEELRTELAPMETVRQKIDEECRRHSNSIIWASFMLVGAEAGVFARLTWWEYSWDIIEPFTFFATFSTMFASFGYYMLTNQNFEYSSAHKHIYSRQFVRRARSYKFDLNRYNRLVDAVEELERDLRRLRDPIFQQMPLQRLASLDSENAKLWFPQTAFPSSPSTTYHAEQKRR